MDLSAPFLRAGWIGVEIGAGAHPSLLPEGVHCEYFDKREGEALSRYFSGAATPPTGRLEDIPRRFPNGADFLLAHNVLEHTPDPIGTLLEWFRYVRHDGIVVLSLPHREYCPGDSRRPVASIEHLLFDYAFREQSTSFSSREHFIAGNVGWAADWPAVSKNEFANGVLEAAAGADPEHHFHAFDDALAERLVIAALWFHAKGKLLICGSPHREPKTEGDIVLVAQLSGEPDVPPEIETARAQLTAALERLT